MTLKAKIYIGTSGWMYKDWGKEFYPKDMKKGFLTYLSQEFSTVEVNTSFYHLPAKTTFKKWSEETSENFVFSVKLSRYITHEKRLKGVRLSLERFIKHCKGMGKKLQVILIQIPPFLRYNEKTLVKFVSDLSLVSKRNSFEARFAFEPRHKSWMENGETVKKILKKENVALVFPHSSKIPSFPAENEKITADFVYIRFHGPSEFAASRYGPERLAPWAEKIKEWQKKGLDIFVYFNNDVHGHAIHDARSLKELLVIPAF